MANGSEARTCCLPQEGFVKRSFNWLLPWKAAAFVPICLALLLFGCGREGLDDVRNLDSLGDTVVCFGDSLTEGVGAAPGEDYPSVLGRQLGLPVINAGRRGDTTGEALRRLESDVLERNPRLVVVLLGGNDLLRQIPLVETRQNLDEIVGRIQARGAMVVLAGMKLGLFADEYSPMFQEIAERSGALYVPQVLKGILSDSKLKSDPIHPNGTGYRRIAERLAEKIKPLLAKANRRRARDASASAGARR